MGSASLKGTPSTHDASNYSYASIPSGYALNRVYGLDAASTTEARFNLKTGSRAESYVYYLFDFSSIPADATIDSVTARAKGCCNNNNTNRIATRTFQLYSGTTAKGSATNIGTSTTASTLTLTPGTWTRAELQNCRLRVYAARGTNNTTTTYYFRFYGADVTVTYSWQDVQYTVTSSLTGNGTIVPNGSTTVIMEDVYNLVVTPHYASSPVSGTDNGSAITFTKREAGGTYTGYPAAYTTEGNINGTYYQNAIGKGSDAASVSSNNRTTSSGTYAYVYYTFDTSSIPDGAVIKSVKCDVKGHYQYQFLQTATANVQLFAGDVSKSSSTRLNSQSDSVYTLDGGTWTREEVSNLILRFEFGYYGGNVTGATLTIEYDDPTADAVYEYSLTNFNSDHTIIITIGDPTDALYLKNDNGAWTEVVEVYQKVNGAWVRKAAIGECFSPSINYFKAN